MSGEQPPARGEEPQETREPITGDGWAAANLHALGEGYGFRKIRSVLGVTAFGVNALVLPPRFEASPHFHEEQEELYLVHQGLVEIELGDGAIVRLTPGGVARVDPSTVRRLRNVGYEDAVVVIVGGKGGYVGRDGRLPEGVERGGRPIDDPS